MERQCWLGTLRVCVAWARISTVAFLGAIATLTVSDAAALPAGYSVNLRTGAAEVVHKVELPPGPGGFVPQLAITYSSNLGDGPLGVGWTLGLGEVRCTAQYGVPNYASCARYEWNGQLLTRNPSNPSRYHSEVESFHRIEFDSTANSWEVTAPNGTISRYGVAAESRISAGDGTARWLLAEREDTFGNLIQYTYDADPDAVPDVEADAGTVYPASVTYASGARRVDFLYEPRSDVLRDFRAGVVTLISLRR